MTDEQLVEKIKMGDNASFEYLMNKYKIVVEKKANSYFLVGGSKEDIIQEGMIGLFKATRDFNKNMETSFYYFANMCIERQIITAVKAATRKKHSPLNSYVSLNKPVFDEEKEDAMLQDIMPDKDVLNPEVIFIGKENARNIKTNLERRLSNLEKMIYRFYVDGMSYTEIAKKMGKTPKSIDNALQRIKKKLSEVIAQR